MPRAKRTARKSKREEMLPCPCGCGPASKSTRQRHRKGLGPIRVGASMLAQNAWIEEQMKDIRNPPPSTTSTRSQARQGSDSIGRRHSRRTELPDPLPEETPTLVSANPSSSIHSEGTIPRSHTLRVTRTDEDMLQTPLPDNTHPSILSACFRDPSGGQTPEPEATTVSSSSALELAQTTSHTAILAPEVDGPGSEDVEMQSPAEDEDFDPHQDILSTETNLCEQPRLAGSTSALSKQRRSACLAASIESISRSRWSETRGHQVTEVEEDSAIDPGRSGHASWEESMVDDDPTLRESDLQDYPVAGPGQEGISLWELQTEGFLQRLAEIDGNLLDASDTALLRAYTLKVQQRLTNETFDMMGTAFEAAAIPTLKVTEARVQALSGFQAVRYDCCRSSCVCYTGPYEDLQECPKCHQARWRPDGKPYACFEYLPLIPRLTSLVSNSVFAKKMQYRAKHCHDADVYTDVFDGAHYQGLLNQPVVVAEQQLPHYFFSDPRDIALGLSSDGFGPFKHRNKTAWPLVLFNYNLPPDERFSKDNIISLGTIPGPKKPADMDSFLWPFVQEMVQLAIGVAAFDAISRQMFMLRAFLILVFGDIPAVSMLIHMKGHNALLPCRMCEIKGVRVPGSRATTHYVPLNRSQFPNALQRTSYNPRSLPLRTHTIFMSQAKAVNFAATVTESERLATESGIKGVPLLSALSSLSFPTSFPYDFMHLIWSNLLVNLISLWTGKFKDINYEGEMYTISPTVWEAIGEATAQAGDTIPSAFGSRVPNIALEKSHMTAESYSIWTLYIAPTLLHGRFLNRAVYDHFVELVRLLLLCLEYEITVDQLNDLEEGFIEWVSKYEKIYYKLDPLRASCCPVTVHALLHIAPSIRSMGPVWVYWAFPMERYCGDILRNIRSRRYPYASINQYVTSRAQLAQIKNLYNLHSALDLRRKPMNQHEHTYPDYPDFVLSEKSKHAIKILDLALWLPLRATLGTHFGQRADVFRHAIPRDSAFLQFGRLRRLGGGDTFHASELTGCLPDSRDMTFVRYHLLIDKHARRRNVEPEYEEHVLYGQLQRILVIPIPAMPSKSISECTVIYAVIKPVKVNCQIGDPFRIPIYRFYEQPQLVHLDQIKCVVGRIPFENGWAIVDRSTSLSSSRVVAME